ncbi:ABC transporter permease [Petrocella sp. FN5]|uniref:ABC transporter permease n=1 Tax=Petrocella sp. FN5 TaxID=3032002 RepID=UPI0023DB4181|nr:ABC transporter permease subunit [Petrocella sp. FN5]MDF1617796.1 ABC transporter permease subunit [Petrocella sp. FN5]
MMSVRQFGLLYKTLIYAFMTGMIVMLIAFLATSVIWTVKRKWFNKYIKPLFLTSISMVFVPAYIHALAWMDLLNAIGIRGQVASILVMVMSLLPLGIMMSLFGLILAEDSMVEMGQLYTKDKCVLIKIIFPMAKPALVVGFAMSFVWTIQDYSIPSLFFVNTYALEIFSKYSSTNQPILPFIISLPMMLITLFILWVFIRRNKTIFSGLRKGLAKRAMPLSLPIWMVFLQFIALSFVMVQIIVPVLSLTVKVQTLDNLWTSLYLAYDEVVFTIILGVMTATVSVILATLLVSKVMRMDKNIKTIIGMLLLLPLAIPAPTVGIGLNFVFGRASMSFIYGTLWMPVFANIIRFLSFACMVMMAQHMRLDQSMLESAKIFQKNRFHGFYKVYVPMLSPGFLASFFLVFILTIGELSATLIVVPAGTSTITMRIYNYLHYGSSHLVAGLCLIILSIAIITGFFLIHLLAKSEV